VGCLDMAERRTWEEPRDRRETSEMEVEVWECVVKARFVRRNVSLVGDSVRASPSADSSWNECHVPSRAIKRSQLKGPKHYSLFAYPGSSCSLCYCMMHWLFAGQQ
jgi:hypothetical protein